MKIFCRAFLVLPTWLIVTAVLPFFPKSHPWYGKTMPLMDWARCATQLSVAFGAGFWIMGTVFTISMWLLATGRIETGATLAVFNALFATWFLMKVERR